MIHHYYKLNCSFLGLDILLLLPWYAICTFHILRSNMAHIGMTNNPTRRFSRQITKTLRIFRIYRGRAHTLPIRRKNINRNKKTTLEPKKNSFIHVVWIRTSISRHLPTLNDLQEPSGRTLHQILEIIGIWLINCAPYMVCQTKSFSLGTEKFCTDYHKTHTNRGKQTTGR
jgi:hypothetical protein